MFRSSQPSCLLCICNSQLNSVHSNDWSALVHSSNKTNSSATEAYVGNPSRDTSGPSFRSPLSGSHGLLGIVAPASISPSRNGHTTLRSRHTLPLRSTWTGSLEHTPSQGCHCNPHCSPPCTLDRRRRDRSSHTPAWSLSGCAGTSIRFELQPLRQARSNHERSSS